MSVHQRNTKKKSWYVNITVNGHRIRKAIPEAKTRRQALQAERVILNELFEKRYGIGGQRNFSEFVENSYKPHAIESKKGYYVEKSTLKALTERFGKYRLREITPEEIEKFKRDRSSEVTAQKKKRAKSTVNRELAVLSAVFKLAKSYGEIKENPVANVEYYKNLNTRDRILSDEEEIILFDFIKDRIKFSRQIEILLYTGMRRGELFKLEWRDIDLENGFIFLRKENTKTQKPRFIPMLSNVREIFESLLGETENSLPDSKVFEGVESQTNKFTTDFRIVVNKLGFDGLTVHSLRHTFSTRANKFNVDPFAQKAMLGHSKLLMTDRYTHPSKETLKDNVIGFEQHIQLIKDTKNKNKIEKSVKSPNLLNFKKSI